MFGEKAAGQARRFRNFLFLGRAFAGLVILNKGNSGTRDGGGCPGTTSGLFGVAEPFAAYTPADTLFTEIDTKGSNLFTFPKTKSHSDSSSYAIRFRYR